MILTSFDLSRRVALVTGANHGLDRVWLLGWQRLTPMSSVDPTAPAMRQALLWRFWGVAPCPCLAIRTRPLRLISSGWSVIQSQPLARSTFWSRRQVPPFGIPCWIIPWEDWTQVVNVNLNSFMFLSQAAARHMAAHGGGKIVNVASALSSQGGILAVPYAAPEHAVAGVTRAMANELASQGVNVDAIAPGYMLTDLTAPLAADSQRKSAIIARLPAGRLGTPENQRRHGLSGFSGLSVLPWQYAFC